jgi:hypothetical protein
MGMAKRRIFTTLLVTTLLGGVAWAGWSDIRSKAQDAKAKADEVHHDLPGEMKKIVAAMCAAGDDGRKSAGESAASNGRSTLRDKLETFHRAAKDAIDQLQPIANDYNDGNHSEAGSLISDLKSRRDKLDDQTRDLVNGTPAVVDYILRKSESARNDHRSGCNYRGLSLNGGTVDCLNASSDTCTVVEFAFDNSNSISAARDRASRAKSVVESELKRSSPSSTVSKCKHVETRVDCYKLCPDIDDDGKFREASPSWRERCS